jgi:peroxiredoxin
MTNTDSLTAAFAALDVERARTWPAAQLAGNRAQRGALLDRFDPAQGVQIGDRLDDVALLGVDGREIELGDLVAEGPAALIFFRFATCPADTIALPYYDRQLRPALERFGVPLIAISPQVPDKLRVIADAHHLGFRIASDPDNRLARQLGILFVPDDRPAPPPAGWIGAVTGTDSWELPMPTVLLVDRYRVVRFVAVSPDWLDRPEAETILAAVTDTFGLRDAA